MFRDVDGVVKKKIKLEMEGFCYFAFSSSRAFIDVSL
jgi:hypothetical protein